MISRIILIGLIASLNLFAVELSGTGAHQVGNAQYACSEITFSYTHTNTEFSIDGGEYTCRSTQGKYTPRTFEIDGNKLIENGVEMGLIDYYQGSLRVVINSTHDQDYQLMIREFRGTTYVIESVINENKFDVLIAELY